MSEGLQLERATDGTLHRVETVGLYLFPCVAMENSDGSEQIGSEQSHVQRRQQVGRLEREEAFFQFVNNLSEEDYRLMRDNNLFGTPGEISEEELLSRLQQVKETSDSEPRHEESGGQEEQEDGYNGDSILDLLNSVRRTGNTTRSGHRGNQSWRAARTEEGEQGAEEPARPHAPVEPEGHEADREMSMETSEVEEVAVVMVPEPEPLRPETPPVISPIRATGGQEAVAQSRTGLGFAPREAAPRSIWTDWTGCPGLAGHAPAGTGGRQLQDSAERPGQAECRGARSPVGRVGAGARRHPAAGGGGPQAADRRLPTITLDLQVRRVRPGEHRQRDSIASRTRSHSQVPSDTVQYESERAGFRRTFSRSERAGIRTYVSTIRIPIRRMADTGLSEATSVALQTVIRQIMTGFGELSSLMDSDSSDSSDSSQGPNLPADATEAPQNPATAATAATGGGPNPEVARTEERSRGTADSREGRAGLRRPVSLEEPGTLPFLRLAHFFLLNDEDEDQPRGLTKEQIDNLSTRSFGGGDALKTCSVCITEYAEGHKLRKLPCSHEYHVHCIDRWLSENSTCPICRRAVLAPTNRESVV
ncbi:hypothetical protein AAFF_G00311860 [Aldrovandia affinis]|uniref:RING-type E3 ubiquitin transferase n=1 Tax=Aldrovandia affinis TaxID=143900 RepID=A0AAD7WRK1_9TELE|nr:hypothetical protein AAFF_G00311860 [Aldrovandia affinis]